MAWSIVGVGTAASTITTTLTLTEPAGVANGDLLIACIAIRSSATTAATNTGWTAVNSQNNNNVLTTTSALASGTMLYQMRTGTPDLTFVIPAGVSVALGCIIAYRGNDTMPVLDVSTAATTATAITAVSVTGLTTAVASDLIVAMTAGGQEAAWSVFKSANAPSTASGATNTSSTPSTTTWTERSDSLTTSGAQTSLGIFDAVKTATGATGNLTATASLSAGHVVIAGAFKIATLSSTADAWNYYDKQATITLSASDKTATAPVSSGSVRSSTVHANGTAGKYYAEFFLNSLGNYTGISPTSNTLTSTALTMYVALTNGNITINGTFPATVGGTPAANDTICMAWDTGAERIWFRLNGGLWNNDASANPATGTNGLDASFAAAVDYALWTQLPTSGQSITIRTELAEFTQAVPAGFTSWMGEKKVTATAGSYALTGADVTLTEAGGGPTAYTLPADASSYALSGQATSTELGRLVTATAGAYALTGTDATLTKGIAVTHYTLPADAGSYALTGTAAGLYWGREVLSVAGSYALSGQPTSLEYGRETAADAGFYALSGQSTSLELGKEVLAVTGSYALTGATATLRYARRPVAVPGSYTLTGVATSLELGKEIAAVSSSYSLTGTAATLRHAYRSVAVSGSYTLTGTPANLLKIGAYAIIGLPGSYALTGRPATLLKSGVGLTNVGVWTGSAWVEKPAKVWTGSAWAAKPVKVWNGSTWV